MKIYSMSIALTIIILNVLSLTAQTQTANKIVINEIMPNPIDGDEWVELFNTTKKPIDISGYYIDDKARISGKPYKIPDSTIIPAKGFHILKFKNYFNNTSDDVRFIGKDSVSVVDSYKYKDSNIDEAWYRYPDGRVWRDSQTAFPTPGISNKTENSIVTFGTENALEIHHINVGQADATFIISPSGKTMLIDLGEENWNTNKNAKHVGEYIKDKTRIKSTHIDYVVITHFHLDHVGYISKGGLWYLVDSLKYTIGKTLHRDFNSYVGNVSNTMLNWREYLEGDGNLKFNPELAVEGTTQIDLGPGIEVKIVSVDGNGILKKGNFAKQPNPPSENDYSIGMKIKFGKFDEWIGGDLDGENTNSSFGYTYHDIENSVAKKVGDVDVYRVNHHGSDHSSSPTFIGQLDPEVSIISVGAHNRYGHPRPTVVQRLIATSDLFQTQMDTSAAESDVHKITGNIIVKSIDGVNYNVNNFEYQATDPQRADNDKDGYFSEIDPNDNDAKIGPKQNANPVGWIDYTYENE